MNRSNRQRKALLALVTAVSLAFVWVIRPYLGVIFWGVVLAIVFAPLHRRMLGFSGQRRTLAALGTLLAIVFGVGFPLACLTVALLRQASALYADIGARRIDLGGYLQRMADATPAWVREGLDRIGLGDFAAVREKLSDSAVEASRFVATHLLGLGMNAFALAVSLAIMLYLLFVLLHEGNALASRIERSIPLARDDMQSLMATFTTVIRATIKGSAVMAATQGVLGGIVLWLLGIQGPLFWGVVFGVLSMIPAVGAGLLWGPIALYFLVTGAVWKGMALTFFGVVVLTVIDNTLRPLLVGRDTHMPGYLVLIATLGGIVTFGINGVVIGPVIAAMFLAAWSLLDGASWTASPPGPGP